MIRRPRSRKNQHQAYASVQMPAASSGPRVHSSRAAYAGAYSPRGTGHWMPANIDINQALGLENPRMRQRVRDLVRNFPPFYRAVNAIVAFTVGRGSRFQSLATLPDGSPDFVTRQKIESRFNSWMESCDASGKLHFYELQQLAKRQECECGEYLARFTKPRNPRRGMLALQMYEPENLTSLRCEGQEDGTDIYQGIEYDYHTGEPVAYHFQTVFGWEHALRTWREPACNVLHGFQTLRPGQLRGVTPFAPAILMARDMDDYANAELGAAKMAAKWLAFVKSQDPAASQLVRAPGGMGSAMFDTLEDMEDLTVEYLNSNEEMQFAPPSQRPGDSFDRFVRHSLRMVAICLDIPYEILSGDYTNINYSTSKASRNDFAMFLVPHQFRAEQHFIRPTFKRWLDCEAITQDYLPGYWQDPERFQRAMWIPAGMPSVDPLRDGKAQIDGVQAGLLSPQQVILGEGRDPEEVVEQRAQWLRMCADAGLDATTGGVSTSMANNPAKLGAVEQMETIIMATSQQ